MNFKRFISSVAMAGVVGASALGIGAGIANADSGEPTLGLGTGARIANADSGEPTSGAAVVQPADWRGYYGDRGHGWGHGYGHDYYRGGWPINRWWHPWGGPWHW
jgi:hypothetical protein